MKKPQATTLRQYNITVFPSGGIIRIRLQVEVIVKKDGLPLSLSFIKLPYCKNSISFQPRDVNHLMKILLGAWSALYSCPQCTEFLKIKMGFSPKELKNFVLFFS